MKIIVKSGSLSHLSWFFILISTISACGQLPDYRNLDQLDLKPPEIISIVPSGANTIELLFNEPLLKEPELNISPDPVIGKIVLNGSSVTLNLDNPQETGRKYAVKGIARDRSGNSLTFLYYFYGYNPTPPEIIINEFTTQGSSTHPDILELKVISGGDLGGLVLCEGTTDFHEDRYIFPSIMVGDGEFLLVHFKPQGIPEEVNELENRDESGGIDACPGCLDFWVEGGDGLGGNNGVLVLYAFPGGPLLDGVLYSNRTSSSDTNYRGFGSRKMMDKADQLYDEGGWEISGGLPAPEDGVNPDDSTATRSICRDKNGVNTRSRDDWHITPTGGYSFGEENSDEVYNSE